MDHFNVPATVRASFGAYSNRGDIDSLIEALVEVQELFG
jgi:cysteine desulfurase/selenocysteine lyase